jgi:hypothetical protein
MPDIDPSLLVPVVAVIAFLAGVIVGKGLGKLIGLAVVATILAVLGYFAYDRLGPDTDEERAAWEESKRQASEKLREGFGEVKDKARDTAKDLFTEDDEGEPSAGEGEADEGGGDD